MKRKIISINEEKCTGCGQCIPDCPEGALKIIDGKARLISDLFCDGLGACIGTCPEGAISVIEREAGPYDERAVMKTIVPQGDAVIKAHLEHLFCHGEKELYKQAVHYLKENNIKIPDHNGPAGKNGLQMAGHPQFGSFPGSGARTITRKGDSGHVTVPQGSELRQWPVQLALLNADAQYFDDADLLISADCVPFAYGGFHSDMLKGKILVIFCPKLDSDIDGYIQKLSEVFTRHNIKSITVARMEVPCCGGVRYVVDKAIEQAGKKIRVTEKTIKIDGTIL